MYIDPDKGWVTLNSVGLEPGEGEGEAGHCTAPPPPTIPVYRQWKEEGRGGATPLLVAPTIPPLSPFRTASEACVQRTIDDVDALFFSVTHPPCENYRGRLAFHWAFFCNPTTSLLVLPFFADWIKFVFVDALFHIFWFDKASLYLK